MTSLKEFLEERRSLVMGGQIHEYAKYNGLYKGNIVNFKTSTDGSQIIFEVQQVQCLTHKGFLPIWVTATSHPFVYQTELLVSGGERFRFEIGQWLKIRNYGLYGFVMITPVGHPNLL